MFYSPTTWDPALIIAQMSVLQCCYYLITSVWLWIFHKLFSSELTLRVLLSSSAISASHSAGWTPILPYLFAAPACAWLVVPVVGRARQCLDFVGTVYGFHFIISWMYDGHVPRGWWWWIVHIILLTGTVVLSEFLCIRKEMEDIPRPPEPPTSASSTNSTAALSSIAIGSTGGSGSSSGNGNGSGNINSTASSANQSIITLRSSPSTAPLQPTSDDRESLLSIGPNGSRVATVSSINIGNEPSPTGRSFAPFDLLSMAAQPPLTPGL